MTSKPDISCVIPTRTRVTALVQTLRALAAQELDSVEMEVIVAVNAEPEDGVAAELDKLELPFDIAVAHEPRPGSPAARNTGAGLADGEFVLFLGDDTPPAGPDVVAGHVAAHRELPHVRRAVLGGCVWAPDHEVTPVMDWLERTGKMLDYGDLDRDRSEVAKLYSGNVSIPREVLAEVNGYDERFSGYGWGDYDLALRLWDAEVRVAYRPELLVHHVHRYGLRESLARMEAMGRTADLLDRLHADRGPLRTPGPAAWKVAMAKTVAPALRVAPDPDRLPRPIRDQAYRLLHAAALARGREAEPLPDDPALRGGLRTPAS